MNTINETTAKELANTNMEMTSLEIASLCGKQHKIVLRDIRHQNSGLGLSTNLCSSTYIDSMNREKPYYTLDKENTMILVSGYNVKLRQAIVRRWLEIEEVQDQQPTQPSVSAEDFMLLTTKATEYQNTMLDIIQKLANPINSPFVNQDKPQVQAEAPLRSGLVSMKERDEFELCTLSALIKEFGVDLSTTEVNNLLELSGYITKSSVLKKNRNRVKVTTINTDYFGSNIKFGHTTNPKWFRGKFSELMSNIEVSILTDMA